ncbi:ABC transporter permease [Anaerofilum sp. BX8]|uniref:ABC transporter permease n=1 Tax=Anaerofilum hominis TaxID=2763016 RepID=A0A923KUY2_9FIRM|nr:ABC transporter permease [Anaerofilum hominis]MBC5580191.1 ABC transporter permease [Anaerofilum hominis]
MKAFLYSIGLQWRMDLRNREIVILYYAVPLVFFLFMGAVFSAVMPGSEHTLIQSMTVFGITMGAMLGSPAALTETYGGEIRKAYRVGGVPLWTAAAGNLFSAFLHLLLMSTIIYLAAPRLYGAAVPQRPAVFFAELALFLFACLCVGTLLGLLAPNSARLTMLSQLIFLPSVLLSGAMMPVSFLPRALQAAGKLLPATWGYGLLCAESFDLPAALVLLGIALACLVLSAWRLRRLGQE